MGDITAPGNVSKYKWYVLALASMTGTLVLAMPTMCMPVLFKEISEDLNLSLVQIGVVWGMLSLSGLIAVLLGGMLGDRFGAKRVLIVGCLLMSVTGILRGFSVNFATLAATMFLYGLVNAATAPNAVKALSTWFEGKQLGLANGVFSLFTAVGFMTGSMISATVLSPLLGSWRNVLFLYGTFGIAVSIFWIFSRAAPPRHESSAGHPQVIPFRQSIGHIIRLKRVWMLAILLAGQIACVQGMLGYLPTYLKDIGWTGVSADGATTLFHAASMLGTLPVAMLSNRTGFRFKMLFTASLAISIGVLMLALSSGPLVWAAVIIAGFFRDGFMAVISTTIIETEDVGTQYAGTAIGLTQTVSRVVEFFSPPVGNSLATVNPRYAFGFWGAICAVSLSAFLFLKEKRNSGQRKFQYS